MTGFRLAAAVALILETTAELVVGVPGRGRSIGVAQSSGAVTLTYALVIVVGLVGVTVNGAARAVERRVLRWHTSVRPVAHRAIAVRAGPRAATTPANLIDPSERRAVSADPGSAQHSTLVRVHQAIGVLGAATVAAATVLAGTVAHDVAVPRPPDDPVRVEHPTGFLDVDIERGTGDHPDRRRAHARMILDGTVYPGPARRD